MSFVPDIPKTPVYKAKPNISKQYTQQSEVEKGNIFDNKEALILAVRLKALNEGFQFLTDRSAPERCHLKCYHFNQCDWKLRARLWDNTERYYITHLNDVHTCPKTQTYPNHRNANKKVIGHLLTPKLQDRSRVLRGKDIQQDILSEYKIHISYQQAMKGKHYGIQQVRGSPYEAFEMLPYYCYNLEQKNEGTVTRIKTDDQGVFEMLFIAIGASIRTFLNYLRPVLMIDAAHLKGLYKGTNLVAVAMDGNNQIVPIAFGICKGETGPCWSWWMSVLKECIGDNPNLLFISDRHAAIAKSTYKLGFRVVVNGSLSRAPLWARLVGKWDGLFDIVVGFLFPGGGLPRAVSNVRGGVLGLEGRCGELRSSSRYEGRFTCWSMFVVISSAVSVLDGWGGLPSTV
ncbi:transposase, MuDR, MULE transposase domain protein [Tanacetum coccineum]